MGRHGNSLLGDAGCKKEGEVAPFLFGAGSCAGQWSWCGCGREIEPIPPVQSSKNEIGACGMKIGAFLGSFKYGISQASFQRCLLG